MYNKVYEAYVITLVLPWAFLIPCQVEGKAFVLWSLLITIKSLIPVIPVNFIVIQGLTCVQ